MLRTLFWCFFALIPGVMGLSGVWAAYSNIMDEQSWEPFIIGIMLLCFIPTYYLLKLAFKKTPSVCRLTYEEDTGETTVRDIRPLELREEKGESMLNAYCFSRSEQRLFHLNRISALMNLKTGEQIEQLEMMSWIGKNLNGPELEAEAQGDDSGFGGDDDD